MVPLAAEGKRRLHHREAGPDTDWDTTEIYFLKGVHLLVLPGHHLALHLHPAAVTETAATKDTDAGVTLILLCASDLLTIQPAQAQKGNEPAPVGCT